MDLQRLPSKSLLMIVALVALCLVPTLLTAAQSKAQATRESNALPQVAITLSSKGIIVTPASLKPGNHLLTIKNNTSAPRGIEMIGTDKVGDPTVRYTKILNPGKSESFRWYFATGKTVYVRDIMSCSHDKMTCTIVGFGRMRKSLDVH